VVRDMESSREWGLITYRKRIILWNVEERIRTVFVSELDRFFPLSNKKIIPRDSSWSTTYEDIQAGNPYPLWKHPENNIHKNYW
ncbi:unnamed protein product, partial [marine sediment metagenome]